MNALITLSPLTIQGAEQWGVDARHLHTKLGVRRQFTDWIKARIEKYGFTEGQDYLVAKIGEQTVFPKSGENSDAGVFHNSVKNPQGGRPATEYTLPLDMAKELAMVENNEQGRTIRRYFIEVEKEWLHRKQVQPSGTSGQLPALIADEITRALAPIQDQITKALTYRTGGDKGGTKDVATGKQVGRLISMVEDLSKSIALTPAAVQQQTPIQPDERTTLEKISGALLCMVIESDPLKRRKTGQHIMKLAQSLEVESTELLASVERMIEEAVKNSAAYEQAERNRLRAERAEREVHGLKSTLGRLLKIEASTTQPELAA